MMKLFYRSLLMFAICCILASCKKQDEALVGGMIDGLVLNDATGLPIEGLGVQVFENCEAQLTDGNGAVVGRATTDVNGGFSIRLPDLPFSDLCAKINADEENEQYSTALFYLAPGNEYYKELRLTQYTELHVLAPLTLESYVTELEITIPGAQCYCSDLSTSRASGNHYNLVEWTVTKPEGTFTHVDSVYCPVGELTEFVLQL